MRATTAPRAPDGGGARGGLNLEEEDEKENDRHRWRQQQSQNDPGAKACEATCIFCVGMLFLQVAWILYTYGLAGTMNLLMAPEEPLGSGLRSTSTYLAIKPPAGYGSEVVVAHDGETGVQRLHYMAHGARLLRGAGGTSVARAEAWARRRRARGCVGRAQPHDDVAVLRASPRGRRRGGAVGVLRGAQ